MPTLTQIRITSPSRFNLMIRSFLFMVGSLLLIDGVALILQRKIHLGIVLPIIVGLVFIGHALYWKAIDLFLRRHQQIKRLWKVGWGLFLLWCLSVAWFAWQIQSNIQQQPQNRPISAIIVLGSGIEQGQPSAALAKRLDQAAPLAKTHPQALVILSGGLDFGEQKTEAEIMSRYLLQRHAVPLAQMALEDQSTSTELNLKNSKAVLTQQGIALTAPIAIVTSDFHTLRAAAIAKKQGYDQVMMVSAPTPLLIRYNAWLREYFAFISGWLLDEY